MAKSIYTLVVAIALACAQPALAKDCVVVLHGLGRTSHSMSRLADALKKEGYTVVNESYSSRKGTVGELVQIVEDGVNSCREQGSAHINFVTHSLGGILVRAFFQDNTVPEARRVVMLAPPNHGSEIADAYSRRWWYRLFTGPAGQELGTGPEGIAFNLKPIPIEVGVIAGTRSMDPWFSSVMPEPNDGKVSVESSKLAEMKDFITVPYSHTFMAGRDAVARQVLIFLSEGSFLDNSNVPMPSAR